MLEQTVRAVIFKDAGSDQWVALCLEYDLASQGDSEEHARAMLTEAVELYLEGADLEDRKVLYQPIDGEPRLHKLSVGAASLLHS